MSFRRALAASGIVAAILLAGVFGWRWWQDRQARALQASEVAAGADRPRAAAPGGAELVSVDAGVDTTATAGATPMAQRVAVLGLLNKRNGDSRDIKLRPGQAVRIGDVVVRLRACERTAPWEAEQYTGAFVQLDVRGADDRWRRPFSGWLFKERPALNVVPHPIYDVWPKSCTMSFPDAGPDTVGDAAPAVPKRSSARKSAAPSAENEAASASDNSVE